LPHVVGIIPGGATAYVSEEHRATLATLVARVRAFVESVYRSDVDWLVQTFPEYQDLGASKGDFLCYGGYPEANGELLFPSGVFRVASGLVETLDVERITESVARSRFEYGKPLSPSVGVTNLQLERTDAYSFSKAARYDNAPMEVGPLARAVIGNSAPSYRGVHARHSARASEAARLVARMTEWVDSLQVEVLACPSFPKSPFSGNGVGLVEAPRGALGHWLSVDNGVIARYQVITPTTWNGSPRDEAAQPGPMESALEGVSVKDNDDPIEVMRIVHSFDPCVQCAVH
jgi:Ni,Fe-hydrogenase I large subunit